MKKKNKAKEFVQRHRLTLDAKCLVFPPGKVKIGKPLETGVNALLMVKACVFSGQSSKTSVVPKFLRRSIENSCVQYMNDKDAKVCPLNDPHIRRAPFSTRCGRANRWGEVSRNAP